MRTEQAEAWRRWQSGETLNFSTGVDGSITYGYGDLDQHGYWQYPARWEWLSPEQQAAVLAVEDGNG